MITQNNALELILKNLSPALAEAGFQAEKQPEPGTVMFRGEAGAVRVIFEEGDRVALEFCEAQDIEFSRLSCSLLELDRATESDCKYIGSDFAEEVEKKFRKRSKGLVAQGKKPPKSVSKSAIKSGDAYYDALAFGNSFTANSMYPELRADYKDNYEKYGEFLAEEFFRSVGNEAVLDTIRQGDKVQMRRLFNLLNDVYENGVNEVQSLVTVTILGFLDATMLVKCVDYMSDDLRPVALQVNKYLASNASKTARKRLENPPIYRPKKDKKPGFFQQMMSGGGGMPGM